MRGLLLWVVALAVFGGTALAQNIPEHVEAAEPVAMEHREIIIPHTPTPAPERPDFDLYGLTACAEPQETHENATEPTETAEAEEVPAEADNVVETLTYLGDWTITGYCPGACCCGEYASGYTASGTLATAGRTIACNSLPFGTRLMIDGVVYTVEDTGYSPYEPWADIFFDTHEEALAWGLQTKEVYLVND